MGVLDQPLRKQIGCCGFNLNHESSSIRESNDGAGKKNQAVMTTEDKQKKQEVDTLLSEAMNTLTFKEREEQQEVLHGVVGAMREDDDLIENALQHLDALLIRKQAGSVYEKAKQMDPTYVRARAFRIMFLRANRYDTKAAANQMLKFFEMKQRLFGNEKLVKDITIDDLDEDDRACLRSGWTQLSGKDRSGRIVLLQPLHLRAFKTLQNEMRVKFYISMALLQTDEDAQLRGICGVTYAVEDCTDSMNGAGYFEHIDLANLRFRSTCNLGIKAMPPKLRARFRLHFGSHVECQYSLATYGISSENLPLVPGSNEVDLTPHLQWCHLHLVKPRSHALIVEPNRYPHLALSQYSLVATEPTPKDVICRRGVKINSAGNEYLRNLVAAWFQTYDADSTNFDKRCVVDGLIDAIHRSGGRFLSKADAADSEWEIVPSDEVRLKITQMFRNHRRKMRHTGK